MNQLRLFNPREPRPGIYDYWHKRLNNALSDCWHWRNTPNSTAASVAGQFMAFAWLLHDHGQISTDRLERLARFETAQRRHERWAWARHLARLEFMA